MKANALKAASAAGSNLPGVKHIGAAADFVGGSKTFPFVAATFTIVGLAALRDPSKGIDLHRLVVGTIVLVFMLSLAGAVAPGVANGFAALLLVSALIKYGPAAFGSNATPSPAPAPSK